jgi:hypothetical protein
VSPAGGAGLRLLRSRFAKSECADSRCKCGRLSSFSFCRGLAAANRKETSMSPFCLIDVASIRGYDAVPHGQHNALWHARFTAWIARLVHVRPH